MRVGERLLLTMSRDPAAADFPAAGVDWTIEEATRGFETEFPDFIQFIENRDVVDFGCGKGYQSVALALRGARSVLGIDISASALDQANRLATQHGVQERLRFVQQAEKSHYGQFDVVISQNSMEHFADPDDILNQMSLLLRKGGTMLISFSPPWYSAYGSHMHFFTRVPWVHLLFSERTVMNVRARYRSDGAKRYEEVEGGLNRMSLHKFERLVRRRGVEILGIRYRAFRGMRWPTHLPLARELLVSGVSCALRRAD
jgi:SAM-dependent methyltransferase